MQSPSAAQVTAGLPAQIPPTQGPREMAHAAWSAQRWPALPPPPQTLPLSHSSPSSMRALPHRRAWLADEEREELTALEREEDGPVPLTELPEPCEEGRGQAEQSRHRPESSSPRAQNN